MPRVDALKFLHRTFVLAALTALLAVPSALAQFGDVDVDKTGPAESFADTDVTYTITLTNIGANAASTVTLQDNVPEGMTFVSAAQTGGAPAFSCTDPGQGNTGLVSCSTATMAPGQTATFTFIFHIAPMTGSGTIFTNTATVTTTPADDNPANNTASVNTTVTSPGDIAIQKTGPAQANAGTNVTYSITLTNIATEPATNVVLTDNIPAGMTFVSGGQTGGAPAFVCTDPGVGNNGPVQCTTASMAPGQTATFTFVFQIPLMTPPGTDFTNTATVATTPSDDNGENNASTAVTSTPPPPIADLRVTKTGPTAGGADTDVTYTITLANNGPDASGAISLTDTLPGTMTFVSLNQTGATLNCTTPAIGAGGTITCTSPGFAAGASTTLTLTAHIPDETETGTEFANTVAVTSPNDPNEENDVATTTLIISDTDVSVVKSGPGTAGTTVSYAITVANEGPDTALNVTLTDAIPPGTTLVSFTQNNGPAGACSFPPVGSSSGNIGCFWEFFAATSAQFTLVLNTGSSTSVTNTARVATDSFDNDTTNNESTVVTTINQSADLTVTKNGPATVTPGTNVTYTVAIANNGPSHAQTVTLSDTLPPNTTFVSATQNSGPPFLCTGGAAVNCTIATFNAGATATFTFVFAVAPSATGILNNTASINAATADPVANNSSTTSATLTPTADVGIAKTGPAAVTPGANATYTITVTNAGASNAQNVGWADTLPANTTFVSLNQGSGPAFICTTGPTVACNIQTLAAGATATFTLVVAVSPATPNGSTVQNSATIASGTPDPNAANTTSTTTATVGASADLTVTKTGPATANAAQTITYSITVTNSGPSDAQNVVLTDNIPAQTTFNSLTQNSGPPFNCTNPAAGGTGTITCTLAAMNAGTTATFTLVLNVSAGATGTITNSATATSSTTEGVPGNNTGTSSPAAAVGGGSDVGITKTTSGGPFLANGVAQFDIVVTNNGPDIASGTTVTDVLPAGTTLISASSTQGTCTGTTTVVCTVGTLAVGGSATINLVVRLPGGPAVLSNTATVTTSNPDPNAANNSSTVTVALGQGANIPALSPLMLLLCAASLGLAGWLVTRNT